MGNANNAAECRCLCSRDISRDEDLMYEAVPADYTRPRQVHLVRDDQLGFGFFAGGESPVVVRSVAKGGPAWQKLLPGDAILQINDDDVMNAGRSQVVQLIKSSKDSVTLVVCQPSGHYIQSSKKSALLTPTKKVSLRSRSQRVRFLEPTVICEIPSDKIQCEVQNNPNMPPNVLRVFLETGDIKPFKYDEETTVGDVLHSLQEKLKIKNIKHFALVLQNISIKGNQKMSMLQCQDCLSEIAKRPGAKHSQCLFRLVFVPLNVYDLLLQDTMAFDYFYTQCCNDVIQDRWALELKDDVALNLAALSILQHWLDTGNSRAKLSVNYVDKEWGLENFVSASLVDAVRRRKSELHKLLDQQLKDCLHSKGKSGRRLTGLQAKLHYLRIISQLPSYGTKGFLDKRNGSLVIVGPRFGIQRVTDGDTAAVTLSDAIEFRQINRLHVVPDGDYLRRVSVHSEHSEQILSVTVLNEDVNDFTALVDGFCKLLVPDKQLVITEHLEHQTETNGSSSSSSNSSNSSSENEYCEATEANNALWACQLETNIQQITCAIESEAVDQTESETSRDDQTSNNINTSLTSLTSVCSLFPADREHMHRHTAKNSSNSSPDLPLPPTDDKISADKIPTYDRRLFFDGGLYFDPDATRSPVVPVAPGVPGTSADDLTQCSEQVTINLNNSPPPEFKDFNSLRNKPNDNQARCEKPTENSAVTIDQKPLHKSESSEKLAITVGASGNVGVLYLRDACKDHSSPDDIETFITKTVVPPPPATPPDDDDHARADEKQKNKRLEECSMTTDLSNNGLVKLSRGVGATNRQQLISDENRASPIYSNLNNMHTYVNVTSPLPRPTHPPPPPPKQRDDEKHDCLLPRFTSHLDSCQSRDSTGMKKATPSMGKPVTRSGSINARPTSLLNIPCRSRSSCLQPDYGEERSEMTPDCMSHSTGSSPYRQLGSAKALTTRHGGAPPLPPPRASSISTADKNYSHRPAVPEPLYEVPNLNSTTAIIRPSIGPLVWPDIDRSVSYLIQKYSQTNDPAAAASNGVPPGIGMTPDGNWSRTNYKSQLRAYITPSVNFRSPVDKRQSLLIQGSNKDVQRRYSVQLDAGSTVQQYNCMTQSTQSGGFRKDTRLAAGTPTFRTFLGRDDEMFKNGQTIRRSKSTGFDKAGLSSSTVSLPWTVPPSSQNGAHKRKSDSGVFATIYNRPSVTPSAIPVSRAGSFSAGEDVQIRVRANSDSQERYIQEQTPVILTTFRSSGNVSVCSDESATHSETSGTNKTSEDAVQNDEEYSCSESAAESSNTPADCFNNNRNVCEVSGDCPDIVISCSADSEENLTESHDSDNWTCISAAFDELLTKSTTDNRELDMTDIDNDLQQLVHIMNEHIQELEQSNGNTSLETASDEGTDRRMLFAETKHLVTDSKLFVTSAMNCNSKVELNATNCLHSLMKMVQHCRTMTLKMSSHRDAVNIARNLLDVVAAYQNTLSVVYRRDSDSKMPASTTMKLLLKNAKLLAAVLHELMNNIASLGNC